MAFPKGTLFPEEDQQIGSLGKALGHPARVHILRLLKRDGYLYMRDIVRQLPLSEGTVTGHLRKLRHAGFITVAEEGLYNGYALDIRGLQLMEEVQRVFLGELLEGTAGSGGVRQGDATVFHKITPGQV